MSPPTVGGPNGELLTAFHSQPAWERTASLAT
jgi:hypothetical protein